jgi:hypothetical protein
MKGQDCKGDLKSGPIGLHGRDSGRRLSRRLALSLSQGPQAGQVALFQVFE